MHPPTVNVIFILWNREFNYYKEQQLNSTMVKHKLKGGMSFGTKCMKSKTKDTIVENSTHIVESNPFSNMHVHHNVGNYKGGACLDDWGET